MIQILIVLAFAAGYVAFTLVKPEKNCGKCNGWGQRTGRRRRKACPRCRGTGKHFRLGAPLVHRGKSLVIRYARERREAGR